MLQRNGQDENRPVATPESNGQPTAQAKKERPTATDQPPGTPKSSLVPSISLPKGGGAIKGIDEKFTVNPATGTATQSIPIYTSPGRSDFGPKISLNYNSGSGNGPYGLGWSLDVPQITRKTDKGIPKYRDAEESDTFILSGAEDLVPYLTNDNGDWVEKIHYDQSGDYTIKHYRPRIEGLFARIEKWVRKSDGDIHWRSISKDNITSVYGKNRESRIFDPEREKHVFSWLLCQSYDDKGNAIVYEYVRENSVKVKVSALNEKNRTDKSRSANLYLRRIKYGNRQSRILQPDLDTMDWLFEVIFDYDEGHYKVVERVMEGQSREFVEIDYAGYEVDRSGWEVRQDPFSSHRSGFEIRTYRLCKRVLMFHHFDELPGPFLVRSTDFDYKQTNTFTYLEAVSQTGYKRKSETEVDLYSFKSFPPIEFGYSEPQINEDVQLVDPESLENLPIGIDGQEYLWVDIHGEGLNGVLTEKSNAWHYKRNLGGGEFAPEVVIGEKPSLAVHESKQGQILDLAGDGTKDVVFFDAPAPGFYEHKDDEGWKEFNPTTSVMVTMTYSQVFFSYVRGKLYGFLFEPTLLKI